MKISSITDESVTLTFETDRERATSLRAMRGRSSFGLFWQGPTAGPEASAWWKEWNAVPGFEGRFHKIGRFEVTADHLTLLSGFEVSWQYCEFGAPEVDPKRPYGNSDVLHDIGQILGMEPAGEDDGWGGKEWSGEQVERMRKLHREMQCVVEILFQLRGVEVGAYLNSQAEDEGRPWARWSRAEVTP